MRSLHQSNIYIKRKLGLWRAQKCISLLGAKSAFACAGQQANPSHVRQCWAENGNLGKFGSTFRHGVVFAPKQCLDQKQARAMESPKMCLVGAKGTLTCTGPQTTPSNVRQYRAENGNLGKFGPTVRHGTVFAPKQCLYQKEARAMESPKMYFSTRCKKRIRLCGSANYLVLCKALLDRERKIGEIRVYFSP